MLFTIKNRLGWTMLLFLVLMVMSLGARDLLGLSWDLHLSPGVIEAAAMGLGAIVGINALLHVILSIFFGEAYRSVCRLFVAYFRSQGWPHFVTGGLLAVAEEAFFRGVLLAGLMTCAQWNAILSVAFSGLIFGLFHVIPDRRFMLFAFWAVFEGLLLSWLYVVTHSLAALMLAHFVNDAIGFALFAAERRYHWLLGTQKVFHLHHRAFFNF